MIECQLIYVILLSVSLSKQNKIKAIQNLMQELEASTFLLHTAD